MDDLTITADTFVSDEGTVVLFAGTDESGERWIFAAEHRPAAFIAGELAAGNTPECSVPSWALLHPVPSGGSDDDLPIYLVEYAERALEPPDSFFGSYHDDDGVNVLFVTHGLVGPATHRDADEMEESNHAVVLKDLRERFPEDVDDFRSSHWAVGWCEQIVIRVRDAEGEITEAFKAWVEWAERLEEYPVADEDDLSAREYEGVIDCLLDALPRHESLDFDEHDAEGVAEAAHDVARLLFDRASISRADDITDDALDDAVEAWKNRPDPNQLVLSALEEE